VNFRFLIFIVLILFLIPAVSAFDLKQVYISIDRSGDAVITATYNENPAEFVGIKTASATVLPSQIGNQVQRPTSVICTNYGISGIRVSNFADVNGNRFETPKVDLTAAQASLPSGYSIGVQPDVTIVFPDGYSVVQKSASVIEPVSHTLSAKSKSPPPPPGQCTEKKTPVSGIIPDQLVPAAAVGAGVAVTAFGLSTFGSLISAWFAHIIAYLQNMIGGIFAGKLADRSKEKRKEAQAPVKQSKGLTRKEILILSAGAVIIGILILYAARLPFTPTLVTIYIVMGGIALIAHEIAHWYFNRKYKSQTEVQFWGLGAVIMAFTAGVFGCAFAQPTLTIVRSEAPLDKRQIGHIMLAGPLFSIAFALCSLALLPLGGLYKTAGEVGFSVNVLVGVFELLPLSPCEGKEIWHWNKYVWALVFIPMLLVYLIVNV